MKNTRDLELRGRITKEVDADGLGIGDLEFLRKIVKRLRAIGDELFYTVSFLYVLGGSPH